MVLILYGFVVFLATLLGSFVGLGGGVIIKPVLDVINAHSLTEISFFSSCAVFAMSITSTTRHIIKKTPIKPSIVLLVALGSVGGGLLGNYLFNYALSVSSTPNTVRGIQSAILAVFLVCVIIFVSGNFKTFNVKNPIAIFAVRITARYRGGISGYWRRTDKCCFFNSYVFVYDERCSGVFGGCYFLFPMRKHYIHIYKNGLFRI